MNRLILCEGKSDAILLSYYLGKVCGWQFTKKIPKDLAIKASSPEDSVCWYERGTDRLLICAVGGKDNFGKYFTKELLHPFIHTNAFSKIAIVIDRDDREIGEIETSLRKEFAPYLSDLSNNSWNRCDYTDSFGIPNSVETLLVVIPADQQGALETVLLSAISENPYDRNIVEKCKEFVKAIRPEASRYISSNRLQVKANLSVTWAVQSPQKVFDFLDEQIQSVRWEKSETLRACFHKLEEI